MDDPRAVTTVARAWVRAMNASESGGSQPHVFDTPEGAFLVKASNNPQGLRVLPNELVAGLCLDWLGVEHPRPGTIDLPAPLLHASPGAVFTDGTPLAPGEAFGSELWQSDPGGTVDVGLIENTSDVAGALALDTWLQQFDGRQYRVRASTTTPGRYEYIPVDHGYAIGGPNWDPASLAAAPDPIVPSAIIPLDPSDVTPYADRLSSFSHDDAERIVEQVPVGWLDKAERDALVPYLVARATKASAALQAAYPDQGGTP